MLKYDPVAAPESTVIAGNVRFTVLTDRMLRLEFADDGVFEDRGTLSVCNRRMPKVKFKTFTRKGRVVVDTGAVRLEYSGTGKPFSARNVTASFRHLDGKGVWHPGMKNAGDLGGTLRTLDGMNGPLKARHRDGKTTWRRTPVRGGLVSRDGWAVVDDSASVLLDGSVFRARSWSSDPSVLCR